MSLALAPGEISLHGANRDQQLLLTATDAEGRSFDATHLAELTIDRGEVAEISGTVVMGLADGEATLVARYGGLSASVPVRVAGFGRYPPIHFANDVTPLFSKLGCNNGGCHGRAQGQNGFELSVFGYDPLADYDSIVKKGRGRRVFPSSPAESLLLGKPTSRIPHGGGRRLQEGSRDYRLLIAWLEQGMPWGDTSAPTLVALEVEPKERVLSRSSRQQILATAIYSDGSKRDVSSSAQFACNAPLVAEVDSSGLARSGELPGEAAVTVNYMGQVAAVRLQVPRGPLPADSAPLAINNEIDRLAWAKLRKMGMTPSELCDDATFLRRAFLDTLGTAPTAAEAREFQADSRPDKRSIWIDRLFERPEYADYWALRFADILLVDREKLGERGAFEFHRWLRRQFAENRPYDEWTRELITATGDSANVGPVNFYRAADAPDVAARSISQAFLGVRVECAQCHHHPFERWSQDDFYGLAGYFNGLERKPLGPGRVFVYHAGYRPTSIPISNRPAPTRPLAGQPPEDLALRDPRVALADWITRPDNPWYARLVANRLWKHYLGRGLVEPEDDLRSTNPPTNEPLLDLLASELARSKFDLQAATRFIMNSRVYQLSSQANDSNRDDDQDFSHHRERRLTAEVMLDAICQTTGVEEEFAGYPPGTRAIQLWDNRLPSYFLEIFGRPPRASPCECGRSSEPTMAQALHLMNAPEIESKIGSPDGRVARLLAAEGFGAGGVTSKDQPDGQAKFRRVIEELSYSALARPPSEREWSLADRLWAADSPRAAAEDFLWTLLNSRDFLFIR